MTFLGFCIDGAKSNCASLCERNNPMETNSISCLISFYEAWFGVECIRINSRLLRAEYLPKAIVFLWL